MSAKYFVQRYITQPIIKKINSYFEEIDYFIFNELLSFKNEFLSLSTFKTILIYLFVIKFFYYLLVIFIFVLLRWIYLLWRLRKPLNPASADQALPSNDA